MHIGRTEQCVAGFGYVRNGENFLIAETDEALSEAGFGFVVRETRGALAGSDARHGDLRLEFTVSPESLDISCTLGGAAPATASRSADGDEADELSEQILAALVAMQGLALSCAWAGNTASLLDLTTVRVPQEEMGMRAARLLIARLEGESIPEPQVVLHAELVVRGSSGGVAGARRIA